MAKKSSVTAIYQANEAERYICTVELAANYPDAIDEARTQAVRGVHELLADAIAQVKADDE